MRKIIEWYRKWNRILGGERFSLAIDNLFIAFLVFIIAGLFAFEGGLAEGDTGRILFEENEGRSLLFLGFSFFFFIQGLWKLFQCINGMSERRKLENAEETPDDQEAG